jgi:hypothetical protein
LVTLGISGVSKEISANKKSQLGCGLLLKCRLPSLSSDSIPKTFPRIQFNSGTSSSYHVKKTFGGNLLWDNCCSGLRV